MRSRILSSAIVPAVALPALALGAGHHGPTAPGFGITRAVHVVTTTVGSITKPAVPAAHRHSSPAVKHSRRPVIRYVVVSCSGASVVRPRTFRLACADGNDYLSKLNWTVWSPSFATATGTQTMNDCTPSCANGKFRSYPVRVILWGSAGVPHRPAQRRYAMITLLYTGTQPSVYDGATRMAGPPSVTGGLWS